MPEISQAELERLQRGVKLLDALTGDKATGIATQRKLKEIDPSLNFPALNVDDTVVAPVRAELESTNAKLAKILEEREAERNAAQAEKMENRLRDSISKAAAKGKLTPEATDNLVKFMHEKGVSDAEVALPAFMETLPKPPAPIVPSPYQPQYANLFGTGDDRGSDENIQALHRDPMKWFDNEVAAILSEPQAA